MQKRNDGKQLFRKSPNYESTITRASAWGWNSELHAGDAFRPACVFESVRDGKWFLERNNYPYYLFELMLEGELEYVVDGRVFLSRTGNLFLTPPGHHVIVRSTPLAHCRRLGLEFAGEQLPFILESMRIYFPENLELRFPHGFQEKIERIIRLTKRNRESEIPQMIGLCYEFLAQLSLELSRIGQKTFSVQCQHLLDEIHADSARNFTLTELCRFGGMNASALTRFFRERFDMTPLEYVRTGKMKHALSLLKHGDFSVKEVASILGFKNQFYFSRVFSRQFGYPPSRIPQ